MCPLSHLVCRVPCVSDELSMIFGSQLPSLSHTIMQAQALYKMSFAVCYAAYIVIWIHEYVIIHIHAYILTYCMCARTHTHKIKWNFVGWTIFERETNDYSLNGDQHFFLVRVWHWTLDSGPSKNNYINKNTQKHNWLHNWLIKMCFFCVCMHASFKQFCSLELYAIANFWIL